MCQFQHSILINSMSIIYIIKVIRHIGSLFVIIVRVKGTYLIHLAIHPVAVVADAVAAIAAVHVDVVAAVADAVAAVADAVVRLSRGHLGNESMKLRCQFLCFQASSPSISRYIFVDGCIKNRNLLSGFETRILTHIYFLCLMFLLTLFLVSALIFIRSLYCFTVIKVPLCLTYSFLSFGIL
jgi:hypothetical protein